MGRYKLELARSNIKVISDESAKRTALWLRIVINQDEGTTCDINVRVHLATKGLPTHYRLSENQEFINVDWIPFDCNYVDFTFSPSKGIKELYGQTKNNYFESNTAIETITLI